MISNEILAVRKQLFVDYVNQRDRLKEALRKESITLNPTQAQRILALARQHYRDRELPRNTQWFNRFRSNVAKYYGAVKLGNWGTFTER